MAVSKGRIKFAPYGKKKLIKVLQETIPIFQEDLGKNMTPVMKESKSITKSKLKKGHGKNTGVYSKSLVVRNSSQLAKGYFCYQVGGNKTHYRLTHLLENGHKLVPNKHFYRNIGSRKTQAIPHIIYGQNYVDDEGFNAVKKSINNAFKKAVNQNYTDSKLKG